MATNSTPTTAKHSNDPVISQVAPLEHLTCNHGEPTKDHFPHPKITLINNPTHHGPPLACHPVPCQDCIHTMDLDYKLPDPTKRFETYGRTQMHEGGI